MYQNKINLVIYRFFFHKNPILISEIIFLPKKIYGMCRPHSLVIHYLARVLAGLLCARFDVLINCSILIATSGHA